MLDPYEFAWRYTETIVLERAIRKEAKLKYILMKKEVENKTVIDISVE